MNKQELKQFLDQKYLEYNEPAFIGPDPVSIPHRFSRKEDIEVAGFFSALMAWGRRDIIIRSGNRLMARMGEAPFDFVMEAGEDQFVALEGFVHRTFQAVDVRFIVLGLRRVYSEFGGLEAVFTKTMPTDPEGTKQGIIALRELISGIEDFPQRTFKHLANPASGSSAKRLNMFLRWMVRRDGRGVDFGLWKDIPMSSLICPLDVHTGNVARKIGLLSRKQNDWKAAMELTDNLRKMDPEDPVKYDFSLFGLGVNEQF